MVVKKVRKIHTFSATSGAQNYCWRERANYGVQINSLLTGEVVLYVNFSEIHTIKNKIKNKANGKQIYIIDIYQSLANYEFYTSKIKNFEKENDKLMMP